MVEGTALEFSSFVVVISDYGTFVRSSSTGQFQLQGTSTETLLLGCL
jgi:hypothetical protein